MVVLAPTDNRPRLRPSPSPSAAACTRRDGANSRPPRSPGSRPTEPCRPPAPNTPADASRAIGPIGVAYDGSPVADAAAELAARIAITLDRQLQVIGVAEPISINVRTEGTARGAWYHQGKNHDVEIYALLRHEI